MAGKLQPVINVGGTYLVKVYNPKPHHGTFEVANWAPTGDGYYYIDIVHSFNELLMPQVQFLESGSPTIISSILIQDKDTLRVRVPADPDCRFAGEVRLSRV